MKQRKICVVTGTRAEYGIMSSLMRRLSDDPRVQLQIIATNMHLSPEFGMTVREIEADGFTVDCKVEMLLSSDSAAGTVKSMGVELIGLADAYEQLQPDLLLILGDRYEMLAAASAATIFGIPVAHLYGGEITEGAYDDSIRHAITKLSYLHFTSTEEYRQNVIQMGEAPERVMWVGALGADNISRDQTMALSELEQSLDFELGDDFLLVTFHPVTKEPGSAERQSQALLQALSTVVDRHRVLITLPNSDTDGRVIARQIREWVAQNADRAIAVTSLGRRRYYAALQHCAAVVGNSSSGLCEAPSFGKPTLNIGNRQKGRTRGNTVTDCAATLADIEAGLQRVLSAEVRSDARLHGVNPYAKADTLPAIAEALISTPLAEHAAKAFCVIAPR
jgi:UDP-N-acetylglucosamine 2-epimerase (non-hydrolysing)/GDP/UDP-N,N'-diacetylbacillosamine 2-epimerase (hydrolysing)